MEVLTMTDQPTATVTDDTCVRAKYITRIITENTHARQFQMAQWERWLDVPHDGSGNHRQYPAWQARHALTIAQTTMQWRGPTPTTKGRGVPRWMVDIVHQAAEHGEPSVTIAVGPATVTFDLVTDLPLAYPDEICDVVD
jgi:hypothetical protein